METDTGTNTDPIVIQTALAAATIRLPSIGRTPETGFQRPMGAYIEIRMDLTMTQLGGGFDLAGSPRTKHGSSATSSMNCGRKNSTTGVTECCLSANGTGLPRSMPSTTEISKTNFGTDSDASGRCEGSRRGSRLLFR